MPNASLCDYSDLYILVEETIIVVGRGANDAEIAGGKSNKVAVPHLLSV